MHPSNGDTLDIKPVLPAGSTGHPDFPRATQPETQTEPAESEQYHQPVRTDNDPIEAARARLSLEAIPEPVIKHHYPPKPVSPVEEEHRRARKATPIHKKAAAKLPSRTKPIISALASFLLLFLTFKAPVIYSQIQYSAHQQQAVVTPPPATDSVSPDPTISIPKINVNAPVVYEPSVSEAAIQKALESGIVHYGTTPVPGAGGNAVFVGHSSNDLWEPGNYKFVFVLLDKLVVGDQFSMNYQSVKYVYQVTNVKVVAPTDLSVLAPTSTPTVTLITCTPPGTSWQRLIIQAKQISPDPNKPANSRPLQSTPNGTILPGSAPGFLNQIKQLWHDIFGGGQTNQTQTQPTPTNQTQLPSGL